MLLFRLVPYALIGSPALVAVAWWRWWGDDRSRHPEARAALLLIGLSSASATVALFWISALVRRAIGPGTDGARMVHEVAGQATFFLMLAALACTLLGKGRGRLLALIVTFFSFVLWLPIPIF